MVPTIAERATLENGGCSLPKYKRREVSAIRDFPPGCGPNALSINLAVSQTISNGDTVENAKHHGDRTSMDDEKKNCAIGSLPRPSGTEEVVTVENVKQHGNHTSLDYEKKNLNTIWTLPCPNGTKEVADVLVKGEGSELKKGDRAGDKKLKEPEKLISDELPSESAPDNPKSSRLLQLKETASITKKSLHGSDEHLKRALLEVKEQVSGIEIVSSATDKETVIGGQVDFCSSHHYPVPSNLIWKERNYPPRRRISAIRDFPPGCGNNGPPLVDDRCSRVAPPVEERHLNRDEMDAENCNNAIMAVLKDIQVHVDDDATCKVRSERHRVGTVARAKLGKDEFQETAKRLGNPGKSSKGEEKPGNSELKNDSDAEGNQEILRCNRQEGEGDVDGMVKKEVMTYEDNKNDKKRSSVSEKIIGLYEKNPAVSVDEEGRLVVLGLSTIQAPQRQGTIAVKSIPSSHGAKGSSRKKRSFSKEENLKSVSKVAEESKRKSMSEKSPLAEMGSHELGELVLWDKRDSSESEELEDLNDFQLLMRPGGHNVNLPPFGATFSGDIGARNKVRETLRLFHAVVRKLLQEEETKPRKKRSHNRRIDQHVAMILRDKGKYVNTGKAIIGTVPGVEVGDEFHYRVELMIIGLHRQSQGGIDYLRKGDTVLATSIVASGGYDNDLDNSDVLIYTGQGGNLTGGDKGPEDQKLERGNLALKNSVDERNVVRVIRGYKESNKGKIVAAYTYDGLYTVERYWEDRMGPYHKMVYKFELRRLPGQPELAWKEVKKSKKFEVRKGLCVEDVSQGKEVIPIGAVNTIDDEKPPSFTYITHMMYPDWCNPLPPSGCSCRNRCSDSAECGCAEKNEGEIPYNHDGAIVEVKSLVYECGPACQCPPSCNNRVSQRGIKFPLEIFKTENRGWGVRSLSSITSGSFICEYIGELLEDKEAEQRTGNDEYLFDIGQNYNDPSLKEGLSDLMPDSLQSSSELVTDVGFTIDAAQYGNVGRFINHSCSPNLYAQNVLYDHDDRRIPHIMLFAAENIPPLQELTYHYNYTIGQVHDKDGNIKIKNCYCGSSDCSGRMY